ncbi:thioredoxin-like domain-containing protein [Coraliomargarita parva]|uniref:thioredoxin-like domain-containing protein n=1 Tax=Coraliomargarita parva TaxID=3014050 RepID=UPI0022B30AAE|nr:thioredoxin-like domain-containing protein [Coraliomargarita parva]
MRLFYQLLLLSLTPFVLFAEGFRTWNMIGGGYFEAKLIQVESTTVKLENREGRVIDFPLEDLKPSDQQFAREWLASQDVGTAASDATFRPSTEFAKRVYSDLVISKGSRLVDFEPESSARPKYFAFYRSAQWCPPCRAFTPDLVDFYKKQKRKGAAFELIFISSDKSEELMAEYMDKYDMDWPAFHYGENKDIVQRNGGGIPNLIVTDAAGNKLLDSYDSAGKYIGPRTVMAELEKLLEDTD